MNRFLKIGGLWAGLLLGSPASYLLPAQSGPIQVQVKEAQGKWSLYRDGKPYYVKGAGGQTHLDKVVECGGNTIRTWSDDNAGKILDDAHAKGLTVCLGLWVGHERHGFDYNDKYAVAGQLEKFRETVTRYKDHPALLMWAVGNEMDLFYKNFRVWPAVEQIAKMIHETDPNHPTMTVTAGIDVAEVQMIREQCPSIDILGVNTYGDIGNVPDKIRSFGWRGPYMITEWGPNGHWESPKYEWGVAREQTGAEKADIYLERYQKYIAADQKLGIGSFVFLWGSKQEMTATWYGLFLKTGEPTEAVDVLQYAWRGTWPDNRAPRVRGMTIDGKAYTENIYLLPGKTYEAVLDAVDPEEKALQITWELMPESSDRKEGGDFEKAPEPVTGFVEQQDGLKLQFQAPRTSGAYRLFVIAKDDAGKVGTMNVPIYIKR
jgi:Glycosyl hydrolases family 2, TIM barrel domain